MLKPWVTALFVIIIFPLTEQKIAGDQMRDLQLFIYNGIIFYLSFFMAVFANFIAISISQCWLISSPGARFPRGVS
jgi:hypothetical protein